MRRTARVAVRNGDGAGNSEPSGADYTLMRDLNRALLLNALRDKGPLSRAALARMTGLAKPTVSDIIAELIADDLVHEIGFGVAPNGLGRPPVLIEFNERSHYLVGVDIGIRSTTVIVSDARAATIARRQIRTPSGQPEIALEKIEAAIRTTAKDAGASFSRIRAVGVVLPGFVDARTGVCLLSPNLHWRDVPVRAILARSLDLTVGVHTVAHALAGLEAVIGVAQGCDDVVLLYTGVGVGAGVIAGGRVLEGSGGIAGEIGHCAVPGVDELCTCGRRGCLETVASARTLDRLVRDAAAAGATTMLPASRAAALAPREIGVAARRGDAVAIEAIGAVGRHLGLGVSWLVNLFDPELVVVAGGLAELGAPLLEPMRQRVRELLLEPAASRVRIEPSALPRDAEAQGAVLFADALPVV